MSALNTHPHMISPIIYLVNAPPRVKWVNIKAAFERCGSISNAGSFKTHGSHKTWCIRLESLEIAEMALATLNGAKIEMPHPHIMELAPTTTWAKGRTPYVYPIMVPCIPGLSSSPRGSQHRFNEFRAFGPLYMVKTDLDLGFSENGDLLYFWRASGAQTAMKYLNTVVKGPWVRIINETSLKCTGFEPKGDVPYLVDIAKSHGAAGSKSMSPGKKKKNYVVITFLSEGEAYAAQSAMNGLVLPSGSSLVVAFSQPLTVKKGPAPANYQHLASFGASGQSGNTTELPTFTFGSATMDDCETVSVTDPDQGTHAEDPKVAEEVRRATETRQADDLRSRKEKLLRTQQEYCAAQDRAKMASSAMKHVRQEEATVNEQLRTAIQELRSVNEAAEQARVVRKEAKRKEQEALRAAAGAEQLVQILGDEICRLAKDVSDAQEQIDLTQVAEREAKEAWRQAGGTEEEDPPVPETTTFDRPVSEEPTSPSAPGTSAPTDADAAAEEQAARDREREAALAESIHKMRQMDHDDQIQRSTRRMAELAAQEKKWAEEEAERKRRAKQEARERAEREERERRQQEERERQEREAQAQRARELKERQERERREREERERIDTLRRSKALKDATDQERNRCLRRDKSFVGSSFFWTDTLAVNRFQAVSTEFDTITFSETQPFTFESAPWPHLGWPRALKVDDIEWSTVEEFFESVKSSMSLSDYKDVVEKSHRRFHPDKWRARRLLLTVQDDTLRSQLEKAGNIVSQALTPIWLESRKLS